jgi:two-component system OmpR family sensor kinase
MNTRSIRFRLTAWYSGLLVLLGLAFGAYCYWRLDHFLSVYLTELFSHRAERIANTLLAHIQRNGEAYVDKEIETRYAPEANDRFIRVTNSYGAVIYISGEPNDQSFDPKKVPRPPETHFVASTRIEHAGRNGLLIATVPFASGQQKYMIEVGGSTLPIKDVLRRFLVSLLVGLIVVLVLAIWGGFMVIKWALAPVKKITSTAEEITLHHLEKRLPVVETGDEIASLSKTLNQMISRLDESFQSVNRFTADASHELRTPLTIIRGELETSLLDKSLSENVRETIYSLIEETENLSKIVQCLLSLSRLDSGGAQLERVRLDLGDLVSTITDQMVPLADEKHVILTSQRQGLVEVEGDRVRLKQVVVNLLDNAIKYTPEGGRVTVGVHVSDRQAQLEISDSGPGITASDLPHVFERFFRADQVRLGSVEGAGLGLSIVQSICTAHGGFVKAENQVNGGCRFIVQLPLALSTSPHLLV